MKAGAATSSTSSTTWRMEKAVRNFVEEKRLLKFELPGSTAQRNLYLVYPKRIQVSGAVARFVAYVQSYYAMENP